MYCLNFPKYFHGYVALPVSATLILNLVKRETSHWTETTEQCTQVWIINNCLKLSLPFYDQTSYWPASLHTLAALGLSKSFLLVSFYRLPLHMEPWMWPSFCSQGPDLQHQFLLTSLQSFIFILPESWTHIKNVLLASQLLYKLTASHRYHAAHICDPQPSTTKTCLLHHVLHHLQKKPVWWLQKQLFWSTAGNSCKFPAVRGFGF